MALQPQTAETRSIKAYAILAGGGVKAAALVGALKAAAAEGVEFEGYGGSSAGALVALLAAVYPIEELRDIVQQLDFASFLDDKGGSLRRLLSLPERMRLRSRLRPIHLIKDWFLWRRLKSHFGLYGGRPLDRFLRDRLIYKLPDLTNIEHITFHHLQQSGCKRIKIVVSDITRRKPLVYSADPGDLDDSLIHAVRASVSYPMVFQPVRPSAGGCLVDGGLSTNLPTFLFSAERKHFPIFAFDLIVPHSPITPKYKLSNFCGDLLSTALEAGDTIHRESIPDIIYVPIKIPDGISTLDFSLNEFQRASLFDRGYSEAQPRIRVALQQWRNARTPVESIQALISISPLLLALPLRALAREIESITPARNVRANVMLPSRNHNLVTTYHYGMEGDPDESLEVDINHGWCGKAFRDHQIVIVDLRSVRSNGAVRWNLTAAEVSSIRTDRNTVLSVPIFDLGRRALAASSIDELGCLGVLSVDTDTILYETQWLGDKTAEMRNLVTGWADIIAKILAR